jgi:UDP-N-acetylmuramoyl-L-alanyl-D-glutamate--2,6-diaminopimelate ligase
MRLKRLCDILPEANIKGETDIPIRQIAYHSGRVGPDDLFVAIRGLHHDGHDHIAEALQRGASCVVMERNIDTGETTKIVVPNSRKALALLAAEYYASPADDLIFIGITGTNGKTTISRLIQSMLEAGGEKVGVIGTIDYWIGDERIPAVLTTPEALDLQCMFRKMVDRGVRYVVMEVSSHALSLDRVYGLDFRVGVFSNLSRDHLDFHASLEAYEEAKGLLFQSLDWSTAKAVINRDDPSGRRMMEMSRAPVLSYGFDRDSSIWVNGVMLEAEASHFVIHGPEYDLPVDFRLIGRFNIYNALATFGVGYALGLDPSTLKRGLEGIETIEGRFERVDCGQPFTVIIDYSHTPDALEHCLLAARELTQGRILVVFGCGGDRDAGKRPLMGEVADRLADTIIITSDNPRTEDPEGILDDIEKGFRPQRSFERFVDRRRAIERVLELTLEGDCVVIAGKGHEDYQLVGQRRIPFNDRGEVERILTAKRKAQNPKFKIRKWKSKDQKPTSKTKPICSQLWKDSRSVIL